MSTIPIVRNKLTMIAEHLKEKGDDHCARLIMDCVEEMKRRKTPRSPARSVHVTPEIRERIRQLKHDNPDWSHQKIANEVGVNPGRVSETLSGHRR